jgi:hypothetical protein
VKGIQKVLFDLPLYGDYECSDSGCSIPAVIRHPETGKFYCAGHGWQLAESHKAHMSDIAIAVGIRRRMLDEGWECAFCDKPAERACSICREIICFDHFKLIPRTGCACPECSEALEQEVAR